MAHLRCTSLLQQLSQMVIDALQHYVVALHSGTGMSNDHAVAFVRLGTAGTTAVHEGRTSCFSTYSTEQTIARAIASTVVGESERLDHFAKVHVQAYGVHESSYDRTIVVQLDGLSTGTAVQVALNSSECRELTTTASWSDPSQWDMGEVGAMRLLVLAVL